MPKQSDSNEPIEEQPEPTVANWDFGSLPAQIKAEDLLDDWAAAIFATGHIIQSEEYEGSEGYVAHVVAFKLNGPQDEHGRPKEVMHSDPVFPSVLWQLVLKRVARLSILKGTWYPLRVKRAERNAQGRAPYLAAPVREEDKEILFQLCNEYMMEEAGLAERAPLRELAALVAMPQIEARASSGELAPPDEEITDAQVVSERDVQTVRLY